MNSTPKSANAPNISSTQSLAALPHNELIQKMQQAETYVHYQEFLLQTKQQEIIQLQQKLEEANKELQNKPAIVSGGTSDSNGEIEEMKVKLQQAADYIQYQTDQISDLTVDLEQTRNQLTEQGKLLVEKENVILKLKQNSTGVVATPIPAPEIASFEEKLAQAAEYIKYQEELIQSKDDEILNLKQVQDMKLAEIKRLELLVSQKEAEKSRLATAVASPEEKNEINKLKLQLEQAAEYVNYQTDQLNEQKEQIDQLLSQLAAAQAESNTVKIQLSEKEKMIVGLQKQASSVSPDLMKKIETLKSKVREIENWGKSITDTTADINDLFSSV